MTENKRFRVNDLVKYNYSEIGEYIDENHTDKPLRNDILVELLNELVEENNKIKSILLKKVEELNDAYNKSAKAGMPTGGIIGELDSFEEICKIMEWIE